VTHPYGPQFVIATDMRKPPGVTMWRNGARATTSCNAASSSASDEAAKRGNTTAPGANHSFFGSVPGRSKRSILMPALRARRGR
jgi:hypothetical protein